MSTEVKRSTHCRTKEDLRYDLTSPSGLRWMDGRPAGCLNTIGYWVVGVSNKLYLAHRLIWELHNGPIPEGNEIDHRDNDRANNCIDNLRLASRPNNSHNTKLRSTNRSGVKGVCWLAARKCWLAQLVHNYKTVYCKQFKTLEEAAEALKTERLKYHKEFANNG